MAQVKWIKIVTDIFDDEKILMIESIPSADGIIVIWFKLLCLAGKSNNSGVFLMNDKIPYTDEMLAAIFRRDKNIVRLALKTFEDFGMIEIVNKTITIPNWSKHQALDTYEKKKERDRIYQQEKRDKQKMLAKGQVQEKKSSDESQMSQKIVPLEQEQDKEQEQDIDIDKELLLQEESLSVVVHSNIEVFKHFEKCGFIMSPKLMEFIAADIEIYSTQWLMDAANECVKKGKLNNYGYLKGILQNWQTKGRETNGPTSKPNENTGTEGKPKYDFSCYD